MALGGNEGGDAVQLFSTGSYLAPADARVRVTKGSFFKDFSTSFSKSSLFLLSLNEYVFAIK